MSNRAQRLEPAEDLAAIFDEAPGETYIVEPRRRRLVDASRIPCVTATAHLRGTIRPDPRRAPAQPDPAWLALQVDVIIPGYEAKGEHAKAAALRRTLGLEA